MISPLSPMMEGKPEMLDDVSLQFAILWTFFFPLFDYAVIARCLEDTWPGFILEMKDAFIAIVVKGPFPHVLSGHKGRYHGAHYYADKRRISKGEKQTAPKAV